MKYVFFFRGNVLRTMWYLWVEVFLEVRKHFSKDLTIACLHYSSTLAAVPSLTLPALSPCPFKRPPFECFFFCIHHVCHRSPEASVSPGDSERRSYNGAGNGSWLCANWFLCSRHTETVSESALYLPLSSLFSLYLLTSQPQMPQVWQPFRTHA